MTALSMWYYLTLPHAEPISDEFNKNDGALSNAKFSLRVERAATILSLKIWQTKGTLCLCKVLGVHSCVCVIGNTDAVFHCKLLLCSSMQNTFPIFCERKFLMWIW